MKDIVSIETLISNGIDYIFILIFCLIGAIVKDAYNTLTKKDEEVKICRILVSSFSASIVIFALSDYIIPDLGYKITMLISFIGGSTGFELIAYITTLGFWIKIIFKDKKEVIKMIEDDKNKKEDDKEEKKEDDG